MILTFLRNYLDQHRPEVGASHSIPFPLPFLGLLRWHVMKQVCKAMAINNLLVSDYSEQEMHQANAYLYSLHLNTF
jgi:hypothetical protein